MQDTILVLYYMSDEVLKAAKYRDDIRITLSAAEIMTVSLVAARFFGGHQERAQEFLFQHHYIHHRLSKSRFNRRLHSLPLDLWQTIFDQLASIFKRRNKTQEYSVDTLPFPCCDNFRICRSHLFRGEVYRGKCASKRRYYFGLKLHLLSTRQGEPVEFVLTPASVADVRGLKFLTFDVPPGAVIYGDKAYNDYKEEDLLLEAGEVLLRPHRKRLTTRPAPPWIESMGRYVRQRIESTFGQLELLLPRHVHAVTANGFIRKTLCFIVALAVIFMIG